MTIAFILSANNAVGQLQVSLDQVLALAYLTFRPSHLTALALIRSGDILVSI